MKKLNNWLNGQETEPTTKRYLTKLNPSDGEPLYEFAESSELDVVFAIGAAHKSKKSAPQELLTQMADRLESRLEEFARFESQDCGTPLNLSRGDVQSAVQVLRHYSSFEITADPLGIVALVVSWQTPLLSLISRLAPALMSGNSVIVKPSSLASFSIFEFFKMLDFLPQGLCNLILGADGVDDVLVSHPGVRAVSIESQLDFGERLAQKASSPAKKVNYELGGKNSCLILEDADLDFSKLTKSCLDYQGQHRDSISRIFVHDSLYQNVLDQFAKLNLKIGDPLEGSTTFGPLISKDHLEKTKSSVHMTLKEGGHRLPIDLDLPGQGYFCDPQIFSDLNNCSEIHHTEMLAPLVTIQPFKYPAEAIKWTNTTPYGRLSVVWTRNIEKAQRLASGLDVGVVLLNQWKPADGLTPRQGRKASGVGLLNPQAMLDFFSSSKTVM